MRTTTQISMLVLLLISCKSEIHENNASKLTGQEMQEIIIRDTFLFDGKGEENKSLNFKSQLKIKLKDLSTLENNYEIRKIGQLAIEKSIVYRGIKKLTKLTHKRMYFEIKNFDKLEDHIEQINFASIKGKKDLGGKLFPRASIEELIFNSDEIANRLVTFVNQIKEKGIAWEDVDKSPSSIFNEGNKVYYISTGGWYMKPFYKEIENKIQN